MNEPRTLTLIDELRNLPAETSWVEFKENNADPQMIGKLISALSNAARLADQPDFASRGLRRLARRPQVAHSQCPAARHAGVRSKIGAVSVV